MRNILTIITIATLSFLFTSNAFAQAEDIYGNQIANQVTTAVKKQNNASYKVVIAFKNGKKTSKNYNRALSSLQMAVQNHEVQVIEATNNIVTIAQEGNTVIAVNIRHFKKTHGNGFLILANDQEPKVISDFNTLIVNENTITDIALIYLGLDAYDDMVFAF